jgi:hypothetical protein
LASHLASFVTAHGLCPGQRFADSSCRLSVSQHGSARFFPPRLRKIAMPAHRRSACPAGS